jgi:uncharacterized protein YceK
MRNVVVVVVVNTSMFSGCSSQILEQDCNGSTSGFIFFYQTHRIKIISSLGELLKSDR